MIYGMKELSYEERLQRLQLTTLETRRLRGDLLEMFKIMKGKEDVREEDFFMRRISNTRGHTLKLYQGSCRTDTRKYSFSRRAVGEWNKLPDVVVEQERLEGFKRELDIWLYRRGFS